MAFSTREIRLLLTVRNEASRTLRRVARDVGSLDNVQQLRVQAQRLQISRDRLSISKATTVAELESLTTGTKAIKAQTQLANAAVARTKAEQAAGTLDRNALRNYEQRLATARSLKDVQAKINKLSNVDSGSLIGQKLRDRREILQVRSSRLLNEGQFLVGPAKNLQIDNLVAKELALRGAASAVKDLDIKAGLARRKIKGLEDEIGLVSQQIAEVDAAQRNMRWNSLSMGARLASHLGRVLATTGIIAVASLGLAAKSAADFSTQVTRAATQARPLGGSIASTGKIATQVMGQVTDQMKSFPATSEQMADSFYEVFSGSNIQNVGKASKAVGLFNQAAVAGSTDLATMTDAGLTLYNNFTDGSNRMGQLTERFNEFFATVRFARTTPEQFAQSLSNVIPFAKAAGLTFRDVGDAMAVLTRATGRKFTSRDATGLFRQIELLSRPEVVAGLDKMGVAVTDLSTGKMRPLRDILNDINDKLVKTGKFKPGPELLNFFKTVSAAGGAGEGSAGLAGTAQARRAFAFLLQNMEEYNLVSGQIAKDTDEFRKSYEALAKTPGVQWSVLTNQLKLFVLQLGTEVIPILVEVSRPLVAMLKAFNDLPDSTRRAVAAIATVVAVGALVLGPLLFIAGGLTSMVVAFKTFERTGGGAGTFGKLAATAGASAKGMKTLGSEAGAARMGLIGVLGSVGALALLLPLMNAGVISFGQLLSTVFLVMAGAGAMKMVTSLGKANGQLINMRRSMLALRTATFGEIAAVIILGNEVSKVLRKIPGWDKFFRGAGARAASNTSIVPALKHNEAQESLMNLRAMYAELRKQGVAADVAKEKIIELAAAAKLTQLKKEGVGGFDLYEAIKEFQHDYTIFAGAAQRWVNKQPKILARMRVSIMLANERMFEPNVPVDTSKWALGDLTDKVFLARIKQLAILKKAMEDATNPQEALAASEAYHKKENAINAKLTDLQKQQLSDIIGLFDTVATISNSSAITMARNVEHLRAAAEKAPTETNWQAYYAAQKAFGERASDDQEGFISSMLSAEQQLADDRIALEKQVAEKQKAIRKQNVENAKQVLQAAVSNVTGVYSAALSRAQSQLGTLFSGRWITESATVAARNRFGKGLNQDDLMRDIKQQVMDFSKFRGSLSQLGKRGAPDELINQLRELGPEAQQQIDLLLQSKPSWFKNYISEFQKGQKLAADAAMQDLQKWIDVGNAHGKAYALGFVQGTKGEDPKLDTRLRDMILRMFPGVAQQAGASPTAPKNETNNFIWNGVGPDGNIMTQLRDAHFVHRNRVGP